MHAKALAAANPPRMHADHFEQGTSGGWVQDFPHVQHVIENLELKGSSWAMETMQILFG